MPNELTRRMFIGATGAVMALATGEANRAAATEASQLSGRLKILGFSCSPRQGKSTTEALRICLDEAAGVSDRIETELVELAGLKIPGQVAAGIPLEEGERDDFPSLVPMFLEPDVVAILLATPVYFGNMSYLCKAFLDRWIAFREKGFALSGKIGAVLTIGGSRNGGQELTIQSVQTSLMAHEMLIIGEGRPSSHWGATLWSKDNSVAADEFGIGTARSLGRRVAEVALMIHKT